MQTLENGSQLAGYTIARLIARGGMGEVYEAYEMDLDRQVALKIVAPSDPDEHDHNDLIRRFILEARTLAKVNHPNIVTIHTIDNNSIPPFIAMEYIEGVPLSELLKDYKLSHEIATYLFSQMVTGLKCLHDNKILHRDLKPQNILVRADGQIKILDFGIAKLTDNLENTKSGFMVGSPSYMAPELKNGVGASIRSDLWSLGAIFFECLTGKRLKDVIVDQEIRFAKADFRLVPEEMRAIISGMCAPSPNGRYANACEVQQDLQRFRLSVGTASSAVMGALGNRVVKLLGAPRPKVKFAPRPSVLKTLPPAQFGTTRSLRPKKRARRFSMRTLVIGAAALVVVNALSLLWMWRGNEKLDLPPARSLISAPEVVPAPRPPEPAKPVIAQSGPVTLTAPVNQRVLWMEPLQLPIFTWSRTLLANEYEIQVALDERFNNVVLQAPVTGDTFRSDRSLTEGKYFWRLRTPQASTPPQAFAVAWLEAPQLFKPEAGALAEFAPKAAGRVDFIWSCKNSPTQYLVQIARNAQFTSLITSTTVPDCVWNNVVLVPGRYFWRVRLTGPTLSGPWSSSRDLTVKYTPLPAKVKHVLALSPPVIKTLKQSVTLAVRGNPRDLASLRAKLEKPPELKWSPVKGARQYLVQVASSRDFSVAGEEKASLPRLQWKTAVPGISYWRVAALTTGGGQSKFSAIAQIRVMLPAPDLRANYQFKANSKKATSIDWNPAPLAQKYLVQISTRRDLASKDEVPSLTPRLILSKPAGTYFVRVVAVNESNEPISGYSRIATVRIEADNKPKRPKPISPVSGARAPSKNGRISIEFSWSSVEGADSYTLEISNDAAFASTLERRTSPGPRVLFEQLELKDRVYWRVRTHAGRAVSDWSEPAFLDVR